MSKSTPGPWRVLSPNTTRGAYDVGAKECRVATIRDVRTFDTDGNIDPASEGIPHANAHLIAAAPDLLAALRQTREMFRRIMEALDLDLAETAICVSVSGTGRELATLSAQACLDNASAAIAKAEGAA